MTEIKICGIRTLEMLEVALDAGADFIGFVFVSKSPRFIDLEAVEPLLERVKASQAQSVGLWQQNGSLPLDEILNSGIDILQAHGSDPGPADLPVWYATGVSRANDLPTDAAALNAYDRLLFDAKPPKDAVIEGGSGHAFDWNILANYQSPKPWMLAGGLNPYNVAEAITKTRAPAVDVSSGVEIKRGIKDGDLIREFVGAVKSLG